MSIPLDNLYHWVDQLLPDPAVLYVFRPHGSKKISDLQRFKEFNRPDQLFRYPTVICHDQEPLDWDLYQDPQQYVDYLSSIHISSDWHKLQIRYCSQFNLKSNCLSFCGQLFDQTILIHSEKNSQDLLQYEQNGFLGVHYWAHAVISRDWFRFGEYDQSLRLQSVPTNTFLIYCRDWSHRREYRLKFVEMLVANGLHTHSQISLMQTNSEGVHFLDHQFVNSQFKLTNPECLTYISNNTYTADASASYTSEDFVNSILSVVLETVFDQGGIHLTEKTLRPIACGHPFVLAAGPGSLEYIRNYGFQTFEPWIDESYDKETDSLKRLEKIIHAMKQIQQLQGKQLQDFCQAVSAIAEFNKKHFFSDKFLDIVRNELENNLDSVWETVANTQGKHYLEFLKMCKKQKVSIPNHIRLYRTQFLRQLRRSCQFDQSNPQEDPSA